MFLSSHYVDTKLILIKKLNNIYKKSYFYDSLKIKKNISNNQSTNLRKKIFQTSNFLFYEPKTTPLAPPIAFFPVYLTFTIFLSLIWRLPVGTIRSESVFFVF